MYHYIKDVAKNTPYFRYLSLENFRKQLDFFEQKFGFVNYKDFIKIKEDPKYFNNLKNKILLTFDDGLADHYDFVFPELLKRKTFGIFFIPTRILNYKKALDVHTIHYLLGRYGGGYLYNFTLNIIDSSLLDENKKHLFKNQYKRLDDDESTKAFKILFNFILKYEFKEKILDEIVNKLSSQDEIFNNLYLNKKQIEHMHKNDMIIGSHSVNHLNFLKLNKNEELQEIKQSFYELKNFLDPIKTFCYPFGEFSINSNEILKSVECDFAFVSIDYYKKDVFIDDILLNPYTISRYDCNEFKFGKASLG